MTHAECLGMHGFIHSTLEALHVGMAKRMTITETGGLSLREVRGPLYTGVGAYPAE